MTTNSQRELRLLQFLGGLYSRLKGGRDAEQVARSALRETAGFFGADSACLARPRSGGSRVKLTFAMPEGAEWDTALLEAFFRDEHPALPDRILLAPLYRRDRKWRVLGLARDARSYARGTGKDLTRIAHAISEIVHRIDRERIGEVRSRIERKIMEELRPKDLFYQILHGLRTLTGYDHSSALLISGEQGDALELVAEQIAWRKGKSDRIGLRLPLGPRLQSLMSAGEVYGLERRNGEWVDWSGLGAADLAGLLDYNRDRDGDRAEAGMLCAPLASRDGVLGLLKVATRGTGTLGRYEADLLRGFVPQASIAIQNSRRTETLHAKMLQAERKHAVADVARGVAHDVNNALGSILPLVQQMQADCRAGEVDAVVIARDLAEIEKSVQVCRRIFGGMLAFARGAARGSGQASLRRAVDGALAIVEDGMTRRGIRCTVEIPQHLPLLPCNQGDLEQVFFNLLSNARDAMPRGGRLDVHVRRLDGTVEAVVEDTGCGIPESDLERIQEPFFTTKPQGHGLGLSICRSILWGMRGEFHVESEVGQGTRVRLVFPCPARQAAEVEA